VALLGAPTPGAGYCDDLAGLEELAEHSHRHFGIPPGRFWNRWIDPKDKGRWVAILFAGQAPECKVYTIHKKGFD
jgi:hypothetical protein